MMLSRYLPRQQDIALTSLDTFFITYDEPHKERSWVQISKQYPHIKRIDRIKGFDKAHKLCASMTCRERFLTIDGDNKLNDAFKEAVIAPELFTSPHVLSWSSLNSINGLVYGNGGVKCWPTTTVHHMKSHEASSEEKGAVDFCFELTYYQFPQALSTSWINETPYQAFRAGFREGVKMGLIQGEKIAEESRSAIAKTFHAQVAPTNLERLRIWASVGRDVINGIWALYGTCLGFSYLYDHHHPLEVIRDYDWFKDFWRQTVVPPFASLEGDPYRDFTLNEDDSSLLESHVRRLADYLNQAYQLGICHFDAQQSQFFKQYYRNPPRQGLMFS